MVLAAIVPEGMAHIDAAMGIGQAGDEEVFVGKAVRVAGLAGQPSLAGGAAQHHGRAEGQPAEIGRASCRESVCQYVSISVVAVSLKKEQHHTYTSVDFSTHTPRSSGSHYK